MSLYGGINSFQQSLQFSVTFFFLSSFSSSPSNIFILVLVWTIFHLSVTAGLISQQLVYELASGLGARVIRWKVCARYSVDTVHVRVWCRCMPQLFYLNCSSLVTAHVAESSNRNRIAQYMQPVLLKKSLLEVHAVGTAVLTAIRGETGKRQK